MKFTRKTRFLMLVVLSVLIAAVLFTGCQKPETQTGEKTITVQIVLADGESETRTIRTEALYLRGALDQEGLIAGDEGEYGLFVQTVNGITADSSKQEWWCFTKGGADLFTSVDLTPIEDGDTFEITLKTGY